MADSITFVRTRYHYDSYTDFWKLVELSGFPTIYIDEFDYSEYGVFIGAPWNGEWEQHLKNHLDKPRNSHLILWNLERPSGDGSVGRYARDNHKLISDRFLDEVWVSDRRLALEANLRFVTLGSHYGLGEPSTAKSYIFTHQSVEIPKRVEIYKHFSRPAIGPNCWPPERDKVLQASKFGVSVHQDWFTFQEPLRLALFTAYGLPIITETCKDIYPWSSDYIVMSLYDDLVSTVTRLNNEPYEKWRLFGLRARDRMCTEFNFRAMVEEAISQTFGGDWR